MRFMKISWVVVVTLVRFGGVALSLFLLLISAVLRLIAPLMAAIPDSDDSNKGKSYYPNYYDDAMGIDDFGGSLKPGEEGRSVIKR